MAYNTQILVTQGITILLLVVLIIFLLRQRRVIKYEKRFEKFALLSTKEHEKSFFDLIYQYFWKNLHKLTVLLNRSTFLKKYSMKYEHFIRFEQREEIHPMDYISLKFIIAFLFVLLNTLTAMFQLISLGLINYFFAFLLGFYLPDLFLHLEFQRKRKKVEEDLLKAIIIMNNSFKSGRNIMQAVEIVKNELEGAISDEFKKIYMDMTYGLSLEVVFDRFYNRIKLDDAKYITNSLTMLNKTGGNIVKVFGSIERSFFEKKKLKNEMRSLTSASIFVFRILCVLPFLFIFFIFLLNPGYFNPIFETTLGHISLIFIVLLYTLYILVIKKVLEVKI